MDQRNISLLTGCYFNSETWQETLLSTSPEAALQTSALQTSVLANDLDTPVTQFQSLSATT